MTHYLKTYKKLENIGILMSSELKYDTLNFKYDCAYLLSAIPQKKRKNTRRTPLVKGFETKSWRFNKSLYGRLGVSKNILPIVGSSLQLTGILHDYEYAMRAPQTKLHLCLHAAKLYNTICAGAPQKEVDPDHYLGCLFIGPDLKPLFISSDQFLNTDTRDLNTAVRVARHSFSFRTFRAPYHNTLRLLKCFNSRHEA